MSQVDLRHIRAFVQRSKPRNIPTDGSVYKAFHPYAKVAPDAPARAERRRKIARRKAERLPGLLPTPPPSLPRASHRREKPRASHLLAPFAKTPFKLDYIVKPVVHVLPLYKANRQNSYSCFHSRRLVVAPGVEGDKEVHRILMRHDTVRLAPGNTQPMA
ncbi:hypothetical protein EDD17DRAFT_1515935 [Pisolithus thermaeus]|nr:hypothetical protein EDD17DRAFT_1515935 [Pisolithus thermaeus]